MILEKLPVEVQLIEVSDEVPLYSLQTGCHLTETETFTIILADVYQVLWIRIGWVSAGGSKEMSSIFADQINFGDPPP